MSYNEQFIRNWPFISKNIQSQISELRISIAGVGSTGGAFVDGLFRLGVRNYKLADVGEYELNNLNRQMVSLDAIGINKAQYYREKIEGTLKNSSVEVFKEGITPENIDSFLDSADFVFDAVDVTTQSGVEMKLMLHEKACEKKLMVLSALDLGLTQWVRKYDYRELREPLDGSIENARKEKIPLLAVIDHICPLEDVPGDVLEELARLVIEPEASACQLGAACFLLSALVTPYICRFVQEKEIPTIVSVDLRDPFLSDDERDSLSHHKTSQLSHLKRLLAELRKG